MKKTVLFLTILCSVLLCQRVAAQRFNEAVYYDAIYLKDSCFSVEDGNVLTNTANLVAVLRKYYPNASITSALLKTNPFLVDYVPGVFAQGSGGSTFRKGLNAIGNLDVTTIADGLAKFLVTRTKEELSIAFFNSFRDVLNDPKYADLRMLFPQTASMLNLIDQNIYQFSMYLTGLRDVFIVDLSNLPESFSYVIHQPKYQPFFARNRVLLQVFQLGAQTSRLILSKDSLQHAGLFIEQLQPNVFFPPTDPDSKTINGSLQTLQMVSLSFKSLDTEQKKKYWISADSAFRVLEDPVTFKLYMGLLYAQSDRIVFAQDSLQRILRQIARGARSVDSLRNSIYGFYTRLGSYNQYANMLYKIRRNEDKDSISVFVYGLLNASLDIMENGLSLANSWRHSNDPSVTVFIPALRNISQVYLYTAQKRYVLAVSSLVKASDLVLQKAFKDDVKNASYQKFIHKLNLYGTFIAQVAKAENSDEVADIIDRTVLPAGSSYIKKHAYWNISLNAYTGLYYGRQRQAADTTAVDAAGVYAPVGIAVSRGFYLSRSRRNPWSASLFFSIIDIGPLASFRFSSYNDTLANDIRIRLNQVLSPGVHLAVGLPKVPVSVGFGGSWSPLLSGVEKSRVVTQASQRFRWQIFAAVDIPLLNFYNKPR